ncbi:uncharacterized protein [Palaemon carinicauda]|uniref:uncharacterized protein n=1 Tax=Palaemon carinicauda TaxID=392227 RepID=UPI0035B59B59
MRFNHSENSFYPTACDGMRVFDIGPDGIADAITRIELPNLYSLLKDLHFRGCLEPQLDFPLLTGLAVKAPGTRNSPEKDNLQTQASKINQAYLNDSSSGWVADTSCLAKIDSSAFQTRVSIESGELSDIEKYSVLFGSLSAIGGQADLENSLGGIRDPNDSYIQRNNPGEEFEQAALEQFSLCFWLKTNVFHKVSTVFSYATSFENSNTILIGMVYNQISLIYHFERWTFDKNFEPLYWYLLCLKKDLTSISLTVDGEELLNRTTLLPLPLNGSLVLGNDQDSVGRGYSKDQAFRGKVAGLNIWPRNFDPQEILAVGECSPPSGRLLTWDQIPWEIHGFVEVENEDPCVEKQKGVQFALPGSFMRSDGYSFCSKLGLKFPLPTSQSENTDLISMLKKDMEHCSNFMDPVPGIWLGATYNESVHQYVDEETGRVLRFVPLSNTVSNAIIVTPVGNWWATKSVNNKCVLCIGFPNHTPYYLQGFCIDEATKENIYSLFYVTGHTGTVFRLVGLSGLEISLNDESWELRNRLNNKTLASLQSQTLPFGKHSWSIYSTEDVCGTADQGGGKTFLILSNCPPGYYTCRDGDCVPLSTRCSSVRDCLDNSDESECKRISISEGYNKHLLPVNKNFSMIVSLVLTRLILLDLKHQVVWTTFTFELRWKDFQVNFFNLRDNPESNPLDEEEEALWMPEVKLLNESRLLGSIKPRKKVTVLKEHPGIDIGTDYMYHGSLNHIRYILEYEANFWCSCDLRKYPFDRQLCSINLEITNVPEIITYEVGVDPSEMQRTEDTQRDYTLGKMELRIKNGSRIVSASFQLTRCPNYQLFTIYLPTVFLHGIGYGTLSISAQDFQDRGAMSLTTMLVLVSLYSEVQSDLPSTAFMKYIDFWFIFSIFFLTLIIVIHLLTNDGNNSLVRQMPVHPRGSKVHEIGWRERFQDNKWVLWLSRRVLGIGYIVFQAVYWISLVYA